MDIRVATICDFAQVREGLLSVLSAGITRVWQTQYPAPLGVMVALIFELAPGGASIPREVRFRVENADGDRLAEGVGAIQANPSPGLDPGEMLTLPLVVDFRSLQLPAAGRYQIVIDPMSDGVDPTVLAFRAGFPSDAGGSQL